jgi:hypothetical protein
VKGENDIRKVIVTKKGVRIINRDVFVFVFFLFLAFGFWYINSLEKVTEADVKYPISYINIPKDKVISASPSEKLNLYLKGQGFSILKLKVSGNRTPVLIDLSKVNYKRVPGSKNLNYYIITFGMAKSLAIQLRSGCEITSVKPDTLFFSFEKVLTKTNQAEPENKDGNNHKE